MRAFNGYEAKKASSREPLPAGGYVMRIMDAEEVTFDRGGTALKISLDVAEGAHKDFFRNDYKQQDAENRRWRCAYNLFIPRDDGSERDGWTKRRFGNAMYAIEQSNPGYHWDWNEKSLKGKIVGALFRNYEWENQTRGGWDTECGALLEADEIRNGSFRPLPDRPLKKKSTGYGGYDAAPAPDNDDIPF